MMTFLAVTRPDGMEVSANFAAKGANLNVFGAGTVAAFATDVGERALGAGFACVPAGGTETDGVAGNAIGIGIGAKCGERRKGAGVSAHGPSAW